MGINLKQVISMPKKLT